MKLAMRISGKKLEQIIAANTYIIINFSKGAQGTAPLFTLQDPAIN
jgi:hypothetical protein